MKTKFYIYIISAFAFVWGMKAVAQEPGWTVNPSAYQFSMNITGVYVKGCNFSADTANKIAAFVGSELRGVSRFSVLQGNNALAFLTIFSNQSGGETVRFELYNKSLDSVIVLPVQSMFSENDLQGNIQQPFQFYAQAPVPVITGNLLQASEQTLKFTGGKSGYTYTWFKENTPITGAVDSIFNVCRSGLYKVKITSGQCGLRWDSLQYTNNNASIQVKKELAPNNKIVHRISASLPCENPQSRYTYQLVSGTGSTDNALFTLQGDTLIRINEAQRLNYTIRLKATDSSGYSIEQSLAVEYINVYSGINDILPEEVRIYPNPIAGDNLFIELPNTKINSIKVMDANGKMIREYSASSGTNHSINITETFLVPGIYFIEIRTEESVFCKKLLKL